LIHADEQITDVSQNLGVRRNIASILGNNPLLWCCPTVPPGTGLKYQLSVADGEWNEQAAAQNRRRRVNDLEL
jgi:palmitoyltransferase